jgi:hypothetical protein
MAKSKIWVRRLTLPPLSDVGMDGSIDQREEEDGESRILQEKEQMARGMDLSIISGEGKHPIPHVHGVEQTWGSKFWAAGDDEESSDDDEIDVPTLVEEAIAAGFTIDQLRQAEDELSSPATGSTEVSALLKEGSCQKRLCSFELQTGKTKPNHGVDRCHRLETPRSEL